MLVSLSFCLSVYSCESACMPACCGVKLLVCMQACRPVCIQACLHANTPAVFLKCSCHWPRKLTSRLFRFVRVHRWRGGATWLCAGVLQADRRGLGRVHSSASLYVHVGLSGWPGAFCALVRVTSTLILQCSNICRSRGRLWHVDSNKQ